MKKKAIKKSLAATGDGPMEAASIETLPPPTDHAVDASPTSSLTVPATTDEADAALMTPEEHLELAASETIIETGQKTFLHVGLALRRIRDAKLYREHYATFELYVRERWDSCRAYAYQTIDAAEVTEKLAKITDIVPVNEYQARALAGLGPEQVSTVWLGAVARARENGRPLTAQLVKQVRDEVVLAQSPMPPATEIPTAEAVELLNQYMFGKWAELVPTLGQQPRTILIPWLAGNTPAKEAEALTALLAPLAAMTDHQILVFTKFEDTRHILAAAETAFYEVGNSVVWDHQADLSSSDWSFHKNETLILHLRRGNAGLAESVSNVLSCANQPGKVHPNQLPNGLIRALVQATTREGEMVLVSPGGVATVSIICEDIGRGCLEIEEDPKVYQLGAQRLQDTPEFETQDTQTQTEDVL